MLFGFELWFVLAIVSALSGGLFIFTTKVASERDYDIILLSTASVAFSSVILGALTVVRGDFSGIGAVVVAIVLVNSVAYMLVTVLRHYAQQCIDTAIYYPIYKTLTPALAILIGYLFFVERFTTEEWIGLLLGLLVPLILITRAENIRQKNLLQGLQMLVVAAILAVIASAAIKLGTDHTDNILYFVTLTDFGLVAAGIAWLIYRNGKSPIKDRLRAFQEPPFVALVVYMGVLSAVSFATLVYAFESGPLSIVYTVQSLYILIPIVLSIIYYNEHWNLRKIIAIVLSVAALALLK